MNSVSRDLQFAQQRQRLINAYRIDDEIFYTGYVEYLDNQEVVLRTYDYLGMPDGMCCLKLKFVSEVEINSTDLKLMHERMQMAQDFHLVSVIDNPLMRLTQPHEWLKEILGRSYVEQQAVMLILFDVDHHFQNVEGFVQAMGKNHFRFTVINNNHFDQRHEIIIAYNDVGVIEFLGKDLAQITRERKLLLTTPHLPIKPQTNADEIDLILKRSVEQQSLVEIASKLTDRYFYVGVVKAFNDQQYVLKLVDMSGQFGGYSILRRDSIKEIWEASDYLTFMKKCIQNNLADDTYRQPVLNDDREFDSETDMMRTILEQDLHLKRFIRLQLVGESKTLVGVVTQVDDDTITFSCFDDLVFQMLTGITINLDQVGEIAFDYLDVVMSQRQYLNRK